MSFWLSVTNQARDDITRNAAWWAENHSLDEALTWYDSVYDQLNELLAFPESHDLAAENDAFPYELREKLVGGKKRTYRAIFTIVGSEVRVLTGLRPCDPERLCRSGEECLGVRLKYAPSPKSPAGQKEKDRMDLGSVSVMAEVIVNGTHLGILWKKPFRIDLGETIKEGDNQLELKVTNLWPNRLIGDEKLPQDYERRGRNTKKWPKWLLANTPRPSKRLTFTSHKFWDKDSALQSSGLLGPVVIRPYLRTPLPK